MDQSTDNDDDVIVMPMDAPSITEILDDDEEEALAAAAASANGGGGDAMEAEKSPRPTTTAEDSNEASQDVVVDMANIKMPMPGVVLIKTEPKDDGYKEDEDDAFMDVGTIEPIDDEEEVVDQDQTMAEAENDKEDLGEKEKILDKDFSDLEDENDENRKVGPNKPQAEDDLSVLTVDTTTTSGQSPETIIALDSPMTPATATGNMPTQQENLDGTLEMLEPLDAVVAPVVTIVPNKIRINISKLAQQAMEGSINQESSTAGAAGLLAVVGESDEVTSNNNNNNKSRPVTPEPEILYELKETMREAQFRKMQTVANGVETSGLCAIM